MFNILSIMFNMQSITFIIMLSMLTTVALQCYIRRLFVALSAFAFSPISFSTGSFSHPEMSLFRICFFKN